MVQPRFPETMKWRRAAHLRIFLGVSVGQDFLAQQVAVNKHVGAGADNLPNFLVGNSADLNSGNASVSWVIRADTKSTMSPRAKPCAAADCAGPFM